MAVSRESRLLRKSLAPSTASWENSVRGAAEIARSIALITGRIQSSNDAAVAVASRSPCVVDMAAGLKGKAMGGAGLT